jgi:hypothetical protein
MFSGSENYSPRQAYQGNLADVEVFRETWGLWLVGYVLLGGVQSQMAKQKSLLTSQLKGKCTSMGQS